MSDAEKLLKKLQDIHEKRPSFHRLETEREVGSERSACWGVSTEMARFIVASVSREMVTAETGCGLSTLAFSAIGSKHTVITPDAGEELAVRNESVSSEINLSNTTFAIGYSEDVLPQLDLKKLSFALVDGKHAFPWPIIDWFYFARAMKQGGILIVDDAAMPSVNMLCRVLDDLRSEWKKIETFQNGNSVAYRCLKDAPLDVIWNEQFMNRNFGKRTLSQKAIGKLKHILRH